MYNELCLKLDNIYLLGKAKAENFFSSAKGEVKMREDEKGSVIVEATYVFPIVFFVIFFLLFMGDAYYLQSQVDSLTNQAAVLAAADCADPIAAQMQEGEFKIGEWPELYRYIFTGGYYEEGQ